MVGMRHGTAWSRPSPTTPEHSTIWHQATSVGSWWQSRGYKERMSEKAKIQTVVGRRGGRWWCAGRGNVLLAQLCVTLPPVDPMRGGDRSDRKREFDTVAHF